MGKWELRRAETSKNTCAALRQVYDRAQYVFKWVNTLFVTENKYSMHYDTHTMQLKLLKFNRFCKFILAWSKSIISKRLTTSVLL